MKKIRKIFLIAAIVFITEATACLHSQERLQYFTTHTFPNFMIGEAIFVLNDSNKVNLPLFISSAMLSGSIRAASAESYTTSEPAYPSDNAHLETTVGKNKKDTPSYNYGEPVIAIYHTHTTECYLKDPSSTVYRSADPKENMAYYGDIVASVLFYEYNIQVLHIDTIFDQPYDTAYDKSAEALAQVLEQYPSIVYAVDIHRDGVAHEDSNFSIYQLDLNGHNAAKVMIVLGTNSPLYEANRAFSEQISAKSEELYPGMMRKILEKPYTFNQNIASQSTLIELGSNLTTPQEAEATAVYIGRILGETITSQ